MTLPIFNAKKRGKKGEGRAIHFRPIQLPEDLIEDLKLYKQAYSWATPSGKDEFGNPLPSKVSFEQMLRRWMENVRYFDPEVADEVDRVKNGWKKRGVMSIDFHDVSPFDYPVWEFEYVFDVDGVLYDAVFDGSTFICNDEDKDADGLSLEEMYNRNWPLNCDGGYEFTLEEAHELCRRLAEHAKQAK